MPIVDNTYNDYIQPFCAIHLPDEVVSVSFSDFLYHFNYFCQKQLFLRFASKIIVTIKR